MRLGAISKVLLAGAVALSTVAVTTASAAAAPAAPAPAPQAEAVGTMSSQVSGTFTDVLGGLGAVTGTFSPTKFQSSNRQITATGVLTSTLTDSAGTVLGTVQKTVTMPVVLPTAQQQSAHSAQITCDVLNLVLGPLHLDLLGLVVDLNRVVLDIVAQTGAGNLLGNLLCAITNLLNGGIALPLPFLTQLLNQILAI
ncbi:hypothetical protein AB0M20_22965, partial [Actinoplanes sp. NPDC051633]|uniref:hypothetical protein n=1 Tax=Actinoplanes sp. NPDC051633 TaxID=3155670 RepID=UPI00341F8BB0